MKITEDIQEKIDQLERSIDKELDTGTNDPVQQWSVCKGYHAMIVALEWVLDDSEEVNI